MHSGSSDVLTGEITESQISDLQNYLTSETDPVFEAWDRSAGIEITESQITDLQEYLTTEVDPMFADSPAAGIESGDIENWDKAHLWGDHAEESYLTEELDPVFTAWDRSTGIEITESQVTDLQDYLIEETDPVFMAWDKDYEDLTNKPDLTVFATTTDMTTALDGKVDKETGKGLQAEGTTVGEMQYWDGAEWITVTPGNSGQVLTLVDGMPNSQAGAAKV